MRNLVTPVVIMTVVRGVFGPTAMSYLYQNLLKNSPAFFASEPNGIPSAAHFLNTSQGCERDSDSLISSLAFAQSRFRGRDSLLSKFCPNPNIKSIVCPRAAVKGACDSRACETEKSGNRTSLCETFAYQSPRDRQFHKNWSSWHL